MAFLPRCVAVKRKPDSRFLVKVGSTQEQPDGGSDLNSSCVKHDSGQELKLDACSGLNEEEVCGVVQGSTQEQPDGGSDLSSCVKHDSDQEPKPDTCSGPNEKEVCGVVQSSSDQRWPAPNEPVCVLCGKYGEYICDKTEDDVCSLECKLKNLEKLACATAHISSDEHWDSTTRQNLLMGTDISLDPLPEFWDYFNSCYEYKEYPSIKALNAEKRVFLHNKFEIKTKGENLPFMILDFVHCDFPSQLAENLLENGYTVPTAVQMQTIPVALSKRDTLVSGATGTGKTASFLLPLVHRIQKAVGGLEREHPWCQLPVGLVLAPTHELCMQIEEQAKAFMKHLPNMKTCLVVGGVPMPQQLHRLRKGVQIIVATPGRLNDILENQVGAADLSHIQIVVLDEVDTMLQMGFEKQVKSILDLLPRKPQYLLFSATIPPAIEELAAQMLSNPIYISVGPSGVPNKSVKQIVLWVEEASKKKKLFSILCDRKHFLPPAVVFVESRTGADLLADAIEQTCGITCASLHAGKTQIDRSAILERFQNGGYDVLVATNLLGRGIDLLHVKQVVLFDMPRTVEEYVHQVGRAGRLDDIGFAIAFINNSNKSLFLDLKELFDLTDAKLPAEVLHSQHLQNQLEGRRRKEKEKASPGAKRSNRPNIVDPATIMDILKAHSKRKRMK